MKQSFERTSLLALGLVALASYANPALGQSPSQEPTPAARASEPAAAPEPEPESSIAELSLKTGGYLKLGSLMQGWFVLEQQDAPGSARDVSSTFRVRRAEIKLKGEVVPDTFGFTLMIDPAKTLKFGHTDREIEPALVDPTTGETATVEVTTPPSNTSILQDLYITLKSEYADLSVGQFKVPVSWEGFNSSSKLLLPLRSSVARAYGGYRDVGLRVEKSFEHFGYFAGLFNGEGTNRVDGDNQKDIALRLEAYPIDGLTVGAVGYRAIGERGRSDTATKDRLEGDVRLDLQDLLVQAEYIRAWDGPTTGDRLVGQGMYGAIGYTIADQLQPVLRLGFLDEDVSDDDEDGLDESWEYEVGLNYFIDGHHTKLQTSYSLFDYDAAPNGHQFILSAQLYY